jgi:hypothetical protein
MRSIEDTNAQEGGPPRGVRILEFTQIIAGRSRIRLPDLGAAVVNVEPPMGEVRAHSGAELPKEGDASKRAVIAVNSRAGARAIGTLCAWSPVLSPSPARMPRMPRALRRGSGSRSERSGASAFRTTTAPASAPPVSPASRHGSSRWSGFVP